MNHAPEPARPGTDGTVVGRARPDEAAAVAWLAALTFPLACPPGTPVPTMAAHVAAHLHPGAFREWARSPRHALLVARPRADGPQDVPLGYALVQLGEPAGAAEAEALRTACGPGPYTELSKIYAHPSALGTGVAGRLMTASVTAAAELVAARGGGPLPLWLGTNGENARAQAFYRKHGFEVIGRRTYDVGGVQHDDVVMLHTPR
ncbi:GNAT family N-acetyltransferase [Isoptericola sp. NEAU-Y5]|uniref:GNAT family N-acetyltransferase n=1 Tax=Isoptericola luteus TaxID=2879484 RepID=A0ABS7ZJK7_9MICO|nr:GNAT family N-acetyltransferase [Isoptericola sp. NEAU-Y5]MCA5895196.1 GNAT family N-acetyltransferase [Isoptericola sp. NEAU-Y5]